MDAACAVYGGDRASWADLSTGINPVPYTFRGIPADAWSALPDHDASGRLSSAARRFWRIPAGADVLAVPGLSCAIARIPGLHPAGNVAIAKPTYNEHAAAFIAHGWTVNAGDDALARVVVNPKNPDGRLWPDHELQSPSKRLTIIDESFCDTCPEQSLMDMATSPGTLVLKSFGKFWGFAGPVAEIIAAAILLAQRSLVQHVAAVAEGLRASLADGRQAVAKIVGRDTTGMDKSAVARSAIESAAENLSDGMIAPAFWFLIAGLPGIIAYKVVNTADSMVGYRTEDYREFGWAAARLDDLLNLVPARLTAVLIAFVGGVADWRGIREDANLHRSPNAGWPEAALSRALGIAVAGPRTYDGRFHTFPWVNADGQRSLTTVDIDKSIGMLWKTWGLSLALVVFAIFFL